jgi:hypothetical protein
MPVPPANASAPPPESGVRATRLAGRPVPRRLVPVMLSMTALLVSILAFLTQRNVDQMAAIPNQQANADQVTYWTLPATGNPHHETLFVQNRGTAPISEVIFGLPMARPAAEATVFTRARFGSVTPCTTLKAQLPRSIAKVGKSYIQFTDATGLTWLRTSWGRLNRVPTLHDNVPPDNALVKQRQFLPVKGCP